MQAEYGCFASPEREAQQVLKFYGSLLFISCKFFIEFIRSADCDVAIGI